MSAGRPRLEIFGKTFNYLTAIEFKYVDNKRRSNWEFECVCGVRKILPATRVHNGHIGSCGCKSGGEEQADLLGQKFGRLTPVCYLRGEQRWECLCDCGNISTPFSSSLKKGTARSCGCLRRELKSMQGISRNKINSHSAKFGWFIQFDKRCIALRSSYELIYAKHLVETEVEFQYEPKVFKLDENTRYRPDFYVPSRQTWYEIKGYMSPEAERKIELFRTCCDESLEVVGKDECLDLLPRGMTYDRLVKQWKKGDHSFALVN